MFDPFCSTKPAGTGLGLAISRSIVRAHEGTLEHRPNEPVGACFTVKLSPTAEPSE
jgi:two-component system sensor histidine kinase AtoS